MKEGFDIPFPHGDRYTATNDVALATMRRIGQMTDNGTGQADGISAIPTDPDKRLTRKQLSEALTAYGLRMSGGTLGQQAHKGTGPLFQRWGHAALYRWGDAVAWAETRLGAPRVSDRKEKIESSRIA
jgi:hypothetical protein